MAVPGLGEGMSGVVTRPPASTLQPVVRPPTHKPIDEVEDRNNNEGEVKKKKSKENSLKRKKNKVNNEETDEENEIVKVKKKSSNFKQIEDQVLQKFIKNIKKKAYPIKHFSCKLCNKVFIDKSQAMQHVNQPECNMKKENKSKEYECYICPDKVIFQSRKESAAHFRSVHQEPLLCSKCPNKEFKTRHNLNRHIDAVHGEKRFKCSFCPKAFNRKDIKEKHEKVKHKQYDENPFYCEEDDNINHVKEEPQDEETNDDGDEAEGIEDRDMESSVKTEPEEIDDNEVFGMDFVNPFKINISRCS